MLSSLIRPQVTYNDPRNFAWKKAMLKKFIEINRQKDHQFLFVDSDAALDCAIGELASWSVAELHPFVITSKVTNSLKAIDDYGVTSMVSSV